MNFLHQLEIITPDFL